MKKNAFLVAVFSMVALAQAQAQTGDSETDSHTIGITIPTVALVDIEPVGFKNIVMDFKAPTEAGLALESPDENTALWLNYSFIPSDIGKTASVSVAIDAVNPKFEIKVQAAAASGSSSGGKLGSNASGIITLSATGQNIVTDIGASYTGDGANSGHNLTYSLNTISGSYATLIAIDNPEVTVTYTISEQ
ncbi:hypothetical protein [Myroides guanonis]|nr:hypothetical protein [Myroides guanonis]